MREMHSDAGLRAIDGLQRLEKSGLITPEFKKRYLETISKLSKEIKNKAAAIPHPDQVLNQRIWDQIEEINLTFKELGKVADAVCESLKEGPANMPKNTERAWSIYYHSLRGKPKKQELMDFTFGLRAGYAFGLMYGEAIQ